ncbi:CdaR family protein [Fenollaria sporofastidiosus]|uniref:CdaR family protein n=1 Tax=Fenollaria sporofastidiosus TaxID=2811778 RepID=UPI001C007FA1|nr:CdaR family protein [Fenollaria sporofastidiosus]
MKFKMKKFKIKNKSNIIAKVVSVIIAIFLWYYVMGLVNPEETRTYRNITVAFKSLDYLNNTKLVNLGPNEAKVSVQVKGKKSELDNINENNIKAAIDFRGYSAGQARVPVKAEIIGQYNTLQVTSVGPSEIIFNLDSVESYKKPIEVRQKGEVKENHALSDISMDVENVKLTGPESYLAKVDKVIAEIDLTNKDKTFTISSKLYAVDIKDNQIDQVSLYPQVVNINAQIDKTKSVPIETDFVSHLPSNYKIVNIKTNPQKLVIKGQDDIDGISSIKTEKIEVNDAVEPKDGELIVKPILPKGVELLDENVKISVTYEVEEEAEREIKVPLANLELVNLSDDFELKDTNDKFITLRLKGYKSVLDKIDEDTFKLRADASNVTVEGKEQLKLELVTDKEYMNILNNTISLDFAMKSN